MIKGHLKIIDYLKKITHKPSHAYLFYGPEHVGKTTTAEWFAKELTDPGDITTITKEEEAKNISIKQIRSINEKVGKTALYGEYKVVIIEPYESSSIEAMNAFLKLLEEPPKHTVFILVTHNLRKLLPTITSRTELIRFNPVPEETVIESLDDSYTDEQKKFIARFTRGRIGTALTLTRESIKKEINQKMNILKVLKVSPHKKIELIDTALDEDTPLFEYATSIVRDLLLTKTNNAQCITNAYLKTELQKVSTNYTDTTLKHMLHKLQEFPRAREHNINKNMFFHTVFLTS